MIPVFYGVEPTHIRNQTRDLADAFADHEQRFKDKVQAWKDALRQAADLDTIKYVFLFGKIQIKVIPYVFVFLI